jgi:predicted small secreted protein
MKCFVICAGLGAALVVAPLVRGQEIETFDSPDTLQVGNTNFAFSPPVQGSWAVADAGTITDQATDVNIQNTNATGKAGYGTAYKSIYALDKPPPSLTNGVIDISSSNTLQLDLTITTGDAGPFVDLQDGEGDFWQYFYGYGLVGNAALDVPSQPGETITQGAAPNELILDVPLATPYADLGATGTFDFSQLVLFRLEDDPGPAAPFNISYNDLSAVVTPEPATLGLLGLGTILALRRRRPGFAKAD